MTISLRVMPCDNVKITSKFGKRTAPTAGASTYHTGVDIGGNLNDAIYAAQSGVVAEVDNSGATARGKYIVIFHSAYGFCTLYQHLNAIYVQQGEAVNAGKAIGGMGKTGVGTGVHLHFEIRDCVYSSFWTTKNKISVYAVNPAPYLAVTTNSAETLTSADLMSQDNLVYFDNYTATSFPYSNYAVDYNSTKSYEKMYGRKCQITIQKYDGTIIDVSDLHCIFKAKKTLIEQFCFSYIQIYNLNAETESDIIMNGEFCTINAGYEGGNYGEVFTGNIVQGIRRKENGTDYILEIISVDSERYLSSGFINATITRGRTMRDAAQTLTAKATNPIQMNTISETIAAQTYTRGKVVFGKGIDYLKQMAKSQNGYVYLDNGKANISTLNDIPNGEILRLDSTSGMIGYPTQTQYGVSVKSLLNPQLKCNILIEVDTKSIVEIQYDPSSLKYNEIDEFGVYRIIEIEYNGDTRGNDWYCDLGTIIQSGAWPSMLQKESDGFMF